MTQEILIDPDAVVCPGFLGFGAEWDPKFWVMGNFAGRPPEPVKGNVTEADWSLAVRRIRWMKLPIVRMMMVGKWCVPAPGQYDWETPSMRSLFRHLDVCQRQNITVILTEWGVGADWVKTPGVRGVDDPAYAGVIGTYLEYLINRKGYSCIKYFVLMNEPNLAKAVYGWAEWKRGVENVAAELARRGLASRVRLLGADATGAGPSAVEWHRRAVDELAPVLGGYDVHYYADDAVVRPGGLETFFREQWSYAAARDPAAAGKPLVVGECGMNDFADHPRGNRKIGEPVYGLFMADYGVQAARAGSSSVLAWMLDDNSHEGFYWGLWSDKKNGMALRPWFYPWSLLVRYVPAGSAIFRPDSPVPDLRILAARTAGAPEAWTFVAVNRGDSPTRCVLRVPGAGTEMFSYYSWDLAGGPTDLDGLPLPSDMRPGHLGRGVPMICPAQGMIVLTSLSAG